MRLFQSFGPADWINFGLLIVASLALVAAAVGAFAAYRQFQASVRATRATLLKDLYLQFRNDELIAEAFYKIEYGVFRYTSEFHKSDDERKIDLLLTLCDLVCAMYDDRTLTDKEMKYFRYLFKRIHCNSEIKKYLAFLDDFYKKNNMHKKAFEQFQIYGSKL